MKEKPTIERIERSQFVIDQFKRVNFDIQAFPPLFERVVELANMPKSHFEDAVKMADMVDLLWDDMNKDKKMLSPLQIMGIFWITFGLVVMITAYAPPTLIGKVTDLISGGVLLIIGIISVFRVIYSITQPVKKRGKVECLSFGFVTMSRPVCD